MILDFFSELMLRKVRSKIKKVAKKNSVTIDKWTEKNSINLCNLYDLYIDLYNINLNKTNFKE